jgi:PAS domain S-box-containing protein
MSAQYRLSLVHVLGLLTLAVGVIVIVMACLSIAGWIFGFGVFPFLNQSGAPLGITPDAALCFILCWVSLWVLRESTGKSSEGTSPDKVLLDADLILASLIKGANADKTLGADCAPGPGKQGGQRSQGDENKALGVGLAQSIAAEGAVEGKVVEGDKLEKNGSAPRFPRRLAQLFASVAVVISVAVLAGYMFGLHAGPVSAGGWASHLGAVLNEWGDSGARGSFSTRMAPSAAFAFLLNGVALTMLDVETRGGARPAQYLGLTALFLSLLVALGQAYQTSSLQNFILVKGWPEMTTVMAMIFVALSIGVVCARPRSGLVALLSSAGPGGYVARRLAPAAIVIPVIIGLSALLGVKAGYFEAPSAALLITAVSILLFLALIWRSAVRLRDIDADRALAEAAISKAYSDLQQRVGEQETELRRANQDIWAEMIERERVAEESHEGLTERMRVETRLRESEVRFRVMVSSAPVMIWVSDADKVCNFFNESWLGHTGRTPTFLVQSAENGWAEDVHPEDVGRCLKTYDEAFDDHREFTMEYRLRRHDGQYRWIFNRCAPLFDSDGAGGTAGAKKMFVGYIGYCLDIHERKESERRVENERDELLSREKALRVEAEDVNRLKDEFLATVSHELRAPLNAIHGWVKLLREGRLNPDETARALEIIERGARAQNRIISDLLDVSRIITDKLRLNARPIRPAAAIESAVESLRQTADAKEIDIELVIDDQAGPVAGDSDRLRQIVWNLVSNAIKFTPDRGQVQVRLERVGKDVEITVSDTGLGIAPDFLPFVFDRFRQGDGSSTRRQGGLGLGLAIVRHLTEMHGGSVYAQSPGHDLGATFVVRLPLVEQAPDETDETVSTDEIDETDETNEIFVSHTSHTSHMSYTSYVHDAIDQAVELGGLRVLAVDNDSDARDLIKTILTQYGAVVETAGSTTQALTFFERPDEWRPELLISDIEMPEADGYQLIRKLREMESRRGRRAPAIALTAYARTEDRLRSLSAGFDMHVTKPVEPVELLTIVASLTGRLSRPRNLFESDNIARNMAGDMAGQEAR